MNLNNPFRKKKLTLLFVLFSTILFSQVTPQKKQLVEILIAIEQTYNYKFTYANDVVEGISIAEPPKGLTLNQLLEYLEKETSLVFKILNTSFITINPKDVSYFICGYVIDNEFKEPLSNVTVSTNTDHTITDDFGYFSIEIRSDNDILTFRHIGFNPISRSVVDLNDEKCSNIYLNPQVESLSEIVLSSYIAKGIDKVVDGSINLDFSNFGILPGLIETDVLQTVQALPGIQSIDETVSNINIRGGTNDQNLVLWDGIKMYQSGHFFGLISMFNPLITNDVTLIKNGTSADMSDGVSGTLDMRTDSKITNKINGSVGLNFINSDLFFDIPLGEKSSIQISGRKAINNIQQTPTYKEYYDRILQNSELTGDQGSNSNITFDFYDTSARWLYNITEKDHVQLNFILVENELDAFNNPLKSALNQNSLGVGLKYKREWSDAFSTLVQSYETRYKLEAITEDESISEQSAQENNVSESSTKVNTWYKINPQLTLLNGYQFTETGVTIITDRDNPPLRIENTDIVREHAIYSQGIFSTPSNNTKIRLGVRYNYLNIIYGQSSNEKLTKHIIEPRLSINHKLSPSFSVELLGEFKHQNTMQAIQNDDLSSPTEYINIEKRKWLAANEHEFDVITSKQVSSGINYSHNGWLLSLEGFYKYVDGINTLSQGFLNQYEFESTNGSYEVYGSEFLINKKLGKFSTWLGYSYTKNTYTFENLDEQTFPNNLDIAHTLTLGTSFAEKNLKISAGVNYHSGAPTTLPVENDPIDGNEVNFETANSSRLTNYIRVDASAMYNFVIAKNVKASTGVSIWNMLNQKNIISRYFRVENDEVLENQKQALKLTPNATFRISF